MQQNFPVANVIDAVQRKAELDNQTTLAQSQMINNSLNKIGEVGNSLYQRKIQIAQALAGAQMYAQEHPELVNPTTTQTTTQAPVMRNQTAAYDPATGSVTPNTGMTGVGTTEPHTTTTTTPPPLDIKTLATAAYGMAPKDLFENMLQNRLSKIQQGELALKQQVEPQKVAIEGQKAVSEIQNTAIMRQIQAMLGAATIKNQTAERAQAAQNADFEANKEVSKHWLLHPIDAYNASQAMTAAGQGGGAPAPIPALPSVGQTVVHPSGVKITRIK